MGDRRRVDHEQRIRIADLAAEMTRAIGVVCERHQWQVTYEEICAATNEVQNRAIGHLLAGDEPT